MRDLWERVLLRSLQEALLAGSRSFWEARAAEWERVPERPGDFLGVDGDDAARAARAERARARAAECRAMGELAGAEMLDMLGQALLERGQA